MVKRKSNTVVSNLSIEDARIGFRNFSGKKGDYNPEGNRTFVVFLDPDTARMLEQDGWNVKQLKPRDPDDPVQDYLPVRVAYRNYPPRIVLIKTTGKVELAEEDVHILDWAELQLVDLILRPYSWEVQGKSGIKAYLKTMYATIIEDEFEAKYRNVPDSASSALDDQEDD